MGYFDEIMFKAAQRASLRFGIFNEGDYYEPFEDYEILHCGKCGAKKEQIMFRATYTIEEINEMMEDYAQKHPDLSYNEVHKAVYSQMPPKRRRIDFGKVGVPCKCQQAVIDGTAKSERDAKRIAKIKENKYDCFPAAVLHQDNFAKWGNGNKHLQAAKKYCRKFNEMCESGRGLILCGRAGAGKSVASICLANDLLDRGFTVRYKAQPEIVYEDIEYRNTMLKDIINVNVLIIDDVNLSELSGNGREMLFYVLEARIKAKRPTIITSNITKEGIRHPSNANDKRICQRLGDEQYFYIVEDSSHNYREKG